MSRIRIVTDSGSDISQAQAAELGIRVMPLKTSFGNEEYLEGVNITPKEFFERLGSEDKLPRTSHPTSQEFKRAFKEELKKSDEIICITISAKLSGTIQSALIGAESFKDKITVIDSNTVSGGQKALVLYAIRLINSGLDAALVIKKLEEQKERIRVIAGLDTLEYLKKGGRITAATANVGTWLSVKPIVGIVDGKVISLGRVRGRNKVNQFITSEIDKTGGIDYSMPVCLTFGGDDDKFLRDYIENSSHFEGKVEGEDYCISSVGTTVGTYTGPNSILICYFSK